ncbi:MAG: DnaA-related protein [Gammaproteobacteria bacterium]|nr:DnaA-related protein [Gammaproteobacteria bacterium]
MTFANFYGGLNKNIVDYLQKELLPQKTSAYLWGSPGCGLTHLLHALCETANALHKTTMYLSLKEASLYTPEILANVEQVDILCIDDIDAVVGQALWEEALFDAYNRMQDKDNIWVCTAKTSVRGLNCSLADLQSRLSWGQVFHIELLTEAERAAVLQLRAKERGMIVSDEVIHFLLNHYQRDLGVLLLLLEKLDGASLAEKKRLTIPFVKDVLGPVSIF